MSRDPIAYFITFTTYGTWLRGDRRGSVDKHKDGIQPPNRTVRREDRDRLKHPPIVFSDGQRRIVDETIREVCEHRHWPLHRLNVRTNHVHMVVTASALPDKVLGDCKRRLREARAVGPDTVVWTEGGSKRWLNDETSFQRACDYVEHQ